MKPELSNIVNVPNAISLLRLLMAPIMIVLAYFHQPMLFLCAVLFSGITDILDGFLARRLNQVTNFGAHLDSWGDFFVYSCMAIGAWLLWPDIVIRELPWFSAIVISFTLPVLLGLVKFRALTSYHTWSVKLSVFLTFIGYLLLFADIVNWPFRAAALVCVMAGIEEIIITLLMQHERVDVRSIWQALRYHRSAK